MTLSSTELLPERDLKRIISADRIQRRVRELGAQIDDHYGGEPLLAVCVLKGGLMFFADLLRAVNGAATIDFVRLASYGDGTESSGNLQFLIDLSENIRGRRVLLVDDIIDTGHTMRYLLDILGRRGPKSLELCALVDKKERREVEVRVDFAAFELDEGFLVGYGMDYAEKLRNLDALYVLDLKRHKG